MQINFGSRSVSCKIVFYGPGLSGKTTNIQRIHEQMPSDRKGQLTSIKTKGDRTLFFDFMALDLGEVAGMDTRFQIYTVPGQVFYNATRKLVLQGADGIVFVADSDPDRMQGNINSWQNLQENLAERNRTIHDLPVVVQWNKRDLADAVPIDQMNGRINTIGAPTFEAIALTGEGVLKTLKCVCALVCKSINAGWSRGSLPAKRDTKAAEPPVAAAARPVAADGMRFVSRRMLAVDASSASAASTTAVAEAQVIAEADSTSLPVQDASPEPPRANRAADRVVVVSALGKRSRSARVRLIVAATILAAAAVVAVMHALGMW